MGGEMRPLLCCCLLIALIFTIGNSQKTIDWAEWSEWSQWTICSGEGCGFGKKTRTRSRIPIGEDRIRTPIGEDRSRTPIGEDRSRTPIGDERTRKPMEEEVSVADSGITLKTLTSLRNVINLRSGAED